MTPRNNAILIVALAIFAGYGVLVSAAEPIREAKRDVADLKSNLDAVSDLADQATKLLDTLHDKLSDSQREQYKLWRTERDAARAAGFALQREEARLRLAEKHLDRANQIALARKVAEEKVPEAPTTIALRPTQVQWTQDPTIPNYSQFNGVPLISTRHADHFGYFGNIVTTSPFIHRSQFQSPYIHFVRPHNFGPHIRPTPQNNFNFNFNIE